ncbi:MAG TPA: hypothetical protein VLT36_00890 [Candidatus Dormibacteraeota bacterium]|nr:hypothetical protein [Candidatus Dormibacteraeota bacterium]
MREPRAHSDYLHLSGGTLVDQSRIFEVQTNSEARAEDILASTSVRELTSEEAERMAGHQIGAKEGYAPFLVRGLYNSKMAGAWRIYELGEKLQVGFFSMGTKPQVPHRQALVLLLKKRPVEVCTFCGVIN